MTTTAATTMGAVIGTGPVATVYSGLYEGMPVALKVFPGKAARRALSVFEREQNKLRAKSVPSTVPVHGVEQLADGRTAVRMELCTQSLAALVRRVGRLEPANVIVMGHAAATALAAAHALGVVHGGVNPNNVLFRATGEPLLSDFGVTLRHAFARDPLQSVESLPPETLRDDILDQRTDLYGLGVVLHVALTGRWPHPGRLGEHLGERVLRVLGSPVPAINLPGVSVELSTVIARLLAADPAHRPSDAGVVVGQLGVMLNGLRSPVGRGSARPAGPGVRAAAPGGGLPAAGAAPNSGLAPGPGVPGPPPPGFAQTALPANGRSPGASPLAQGAPGGGLRASGPATAGAAAPVQGLPSSGSAPGQGAPASGFALPPVGGLPVTGPAAPGAPMAPATAAFLSTVVASLSAALRACLPRPRRVRLPMVARRPPALRRLAPVLPRKAFRLQASRLRQVHPRPR